MNRSKPFALFLTVTVLGTAVDLWSKSAIFESLEATYDPAEAHPIVYGKVVVLIDDLLKINCAVNPGVAFSMLEGNAGWILFFGALALLVVVYLQWKLPPGSWAWSIILACIAAGAIGNIYDRAIFGVVRDFIQVHYKDVWSYPTFNVADILIVVGGVSIALGLFRKKEAGGDEKPEVEDGKEGKEKGKKRSKKKGKKGKKTRTKSGGEA